MPIQITEGNGEAFFTVQVTGVLDRSDYEHFVPEFERLVRQHGKLDLLFDMTGFHGWKAAAMWDEVKFDTTHLADINRLAMVGDKQWQHVMAAFSKPFMKAKIQYFDQSDTAGARKWLAEE